MPALIVRMVRAAMAVVLASLVSGCLFTHRSMEPLPDETKLELAQRGLGLGARVFVRIFKLENQMEVWLQNAAGTYTQFRTYPICNWSGEIGPKTREGDRQAPEGFYVVSTRQMNPNSKYYLSFNIGYPNAYDKAHGYTGSYLMVHGGCRSVGCYAITDDAIKELFTLAREAFAAGQRDFPVHAFPFRMTPENLAQRAGQPWSGLWQNLKEGYDLFEATRIPPAVGIKGGRYVFFADPGQVPDEFRISAAASDPMQAQLISGWQ
jgi:murein L,D-transpeptidase YafK